MRKLLVILTLVIVLVSLNWFRDLFAQDLGSLSDAEKAALLRNISKAAPAKRDAGYYETPSIYDSTVTIRRPAEDSVVAGLDAPGERDASIRRRGRLPEFEELRPFGADLFAGPRETSPPDDVASDGSYILGPGDDVIIYLWGRVEKEYKLTIDREGKVLIPKVGEVVAWGKTLGRFKKLVRERMAKVYSEFDLAISLGKIRAIRIYLTGEVQVPGAYTVSSLTSLFNALYLAGGPNENGSMRSVRVMRNGRLAAETDLYRFLLYGDNSLDIRLESGDAIFVPVVGSRVAIRGEVKRPAVYELNADESARDLLQYAGGVTPEAHLGRVMLERIAEQNEWEVIDLNLDPGAGIGATDPLLMDGDRVTVYSIFESRKNMVAVFGRVKHPGYYERNDSTSLSDLLKEAQLQEYDVFLERANLFRRHSDWRSEIIPVPLGAMLNGEAEDILLKDRDSLHVYSIEDITWDKSVYINGEVSAPGKYPYYDSITVSDLIFLAGSYTRAASRLQAEIGRVDMEGNVTLLYLDMSSDSAARTILLEEDRVYIRQTPEWRIAPTVSIVGEMAYPGEYVLSGRDETLFGLLKRAGGFTPSAFPGGIIFERPSISQMLDRLQISKQLERFTELTEDTLGNIRTEVLIEYDSVSVNRIAIDIDLIIKTDGREGDIILEPGDRILVPSIPSGISVLGAVGHNGTIQFRPNGSVKDYIKRAGNFIPRADKGKTRLVKANGVVLAGGGILGHEVELGDVIVVPTKIVRHRDYVRTLSTVLTATTGVLTTVLLITKIN